MRRLNLTGKKIGYWKVGESIKINGKIYYRCTCVCGTKRNVYGSSLNTLKSLSCGCKSRLGTGKAKTLIGKDFGSLHVDGCEIVDNHTYCKCSCKCGGTILVLPYDLISGSVKTCGCRSDVGEHIRQSLSSYCKDGTYVPGITRTSINKNNTSGCTGVCFRSDKGKWVAYIRFQRKHIFLGHFDKYEDAVDARKKAEIKYFGKYLEVKEEL